MITLLFELCLFGVDLFGGTGCAIDQNIQTLEELRLELQLKYFDLTMKDYVGNGCMETSFINPLGEGKGFGSQSWYDGIYRHNVNGTLFTESYCSIDVWDVFEDNQSLDYHKDLRDGIFPIINYDFNKVYFDGEWLRYDVSLDCDDINWIEVDEQTFESTNDKPHKKSFDDGYRHLFVGECRT